MGRKTQTPLGGDQRAWRSHRERTIAEVATHQHGVISRRQLLNSGLTSDGIQRRIQAGRLHRLHRGVYAYGHRKVSLRGLWMAAVLAGGDGAVLSHRSAAALWGLVGHRGSIEVSADTGRRRPGIVIHEARFDRGDRTVRDGIPVTTIERTLLDLAGLLDEHGLRHAFEEADRLHLLDLRRLERICDARGNGRRGAAALRRLIEAAQAPEASRSPLEDRFAEFCREHCLPPASTNVSVLGHEVDAFWPAQRLIVEMDSFGFHRHRAAFERDRARDAARQAAGYRVIRLTHRRLDEDATGVADELHRLLRTERQRGQGTVEWVALLLVIALLFAGLIAAGVRVPGSALARAIASRIVCAAAIADSCGDEPLLIATYGTEVGKLARDHVPTLLFERDSRALPVDFRHCRSTTCGDGSDRGLVDHTDRGLPVTAFVHVVDCRPGAVEATEAAGADCSGTRAGNLYIQYWTYYADSATLRGVPIAGRKGYHHDDWESVQIRIASDGEVETRASSHNGYNSAQGGANWASDARIVAVKDAEEWLGARPENGWGAETGMLFVSGGSHAGNTAAFPRIDRLTPGRRVHLVPLEPFVVAGAGDGYRFAVSPPWRKHVWRDPEAEWTN